MVNSVPGLHPFSSIDGDRVLNISDSKKFFFAIEDKIDIPGRTLISQDIKIDNRNISIPYASTYGSNKAIKIFANNGGVSLAAVFDDFLEYDNSYISDGSFVGDNVQTNTSPSISVLNTLSEKKAPFYNWTTYDLRKADQKSTSFKSNFVQLLISGQSIPDENIDEYLSLVSKKELLDILDLLGSEIINMDVCDDN